MGNSCYDLAQLDWKIEENESVLIWVSGNWTKQISGKQNIERTILNWLEGKYNDWCKHPFPVCWIPLQSKQLLPASVETTAKSDAQLMLVSLPAALPTKSSSSHPEVLPAGPGFSEGGRGGALHVPPRDQAPATAMPGSDTAQPQGLLWPISSHCYSQHKVDHASDKQWQYNCFLKYF